MRILSLFVISVLIIPSTVVGQHDPATQELFSGLAKGDKALILKSLEDGADVNAKSTEGQIPLAMALVMGDLDLFKTLIDRGADIHERYRSYGFLGEVSSVPVLFEAIGQGEVEFVKTLLDHGADIESRGGELGYTALQVAVVSDQLEVIQILVERGANMYTTNDVGKSSLELAKLHRRQGIWDYLNEAARKKYRLDQPEPEWKKFVELVGKFHKRPQVDLSGLTEYILQAHTVNQPDHMGNTVLHMVASASGRSKKVVAALDVVMEYGSVDINAQNVKGKTPLHLAVRGDKVDVVARLLEGGADVNLRDAEGNTPLILMGIFCESGSLGDADEFAISEMLLSKGADVNAQNATGRTALHELAEEQMGRMVDTARLLLENGADVNLRDLEQRTALSEAADLGSSDMVKLLLEHDAEVDIRDIRHQSPIDQAAERQDAKKLELLVRHSGNKSLHMAVSTGLVEQAQEMIEAGADIEATCDCVEGGTVLFAAIRYQQKSTLELLLAKGVNLASQDDHGYTGLHYAVRYGLTEMAMLLLSAGADATIESKEDGNALDVALKFNQDDMVELIQEKYPAIEMTAKAIESDDSEFDEMVEMSEEEMQKQMREMMIGQITQQSGSDFHVAVVEGKIEVVKEMLKKGAVDVNGLDGLNSLALMYAVFLDHQEMVVLLLKNGAEVNRVDGNGGTALVVAVSTGHKEMVELLLAAGADVSIEMEGGINALEIAMLNGHDEIAAILQKAAPDLEADVDEFLSEQMEGFATSEEDFEKQEREHLIERLASGTRQPLHVAVIRGEREAVEVLLAGDEIDVNGFDDSRRLALTYAAYLGYKEIVSLLLEHGAKINKLDNNPGFHEWGRTLDDNEQGWGVLHYLAESGNVEMMRFMVEKGLGMVWTACFC